MTVKIQAPLAFVDTETTGLNPDVHEVWELAIIKRVGSVDVETVYQVQPGRLADAEPKALEIGRFHERMVVPGGSKCAVVRPAVEPGTADRAEPIGLDALRQQVTGLLRGAVLVGSNTQFDATFIRKLLGRPATPPWHYRPVNALELAAGRVMATGGEINVPWRSYDVSRAVGVEPPPPAAAHAALVDARWARDVFDSVVAL